MSPVLERTDTAIDSRRAWLTLAVSVRLPAAPLGASRAGLQRPTIPIPNMSACHQQADRRLGKSFMTRTWLKPPSTVSSNAAGLLTRMRTKHLRPDEAVSGESNQEERDGACMQ